MTLADLQATFRFRAEHFPSLIKANWPTEDPVAIWGLLLSYSTTQPHEEACARMTVREHLVMNAALLNLLIDDGFLYRLKLSGAQA